MLAQESKTTSVPNFTDHVSRVVASVEDSAAVGTPVGGSNGGGEGTWQYNSHDGDDEMATIASVLVQTTLKIMFTMRVLAKMTTTVTTREG